MTRLGCLLGAGACVAAMFAAALWSRAEHRVAFNVAFSPAGDRLTAAVADQPGWSVRLLTWDVATGREVASIELQDRPMAIAQAPDGTSVAYGASDGSVRLLDLNAGRVVRTLAGHTTAIRSLAFGPDGRTLAAGAADGRVILWDVKSGELRRTFDRGRRQPPVELTFSRDGRHLAAAGARALSVWDLDTGQPVDLKSLGGAGEPIAFAPDRPVLAVGTNAAGSATLVDVVEDRAVTSLPRLPAMWPGASRSLAFSPDGRLMASGGDEELVFVQDVASGRELASYDGHRHTPPVVGDDFHRLLSHFKLAEDRVQNSIWSVAFSPDGAHLASAAHDGAVWLWDVPSGGEATSPGHALLPRPGPPRWLRPVQIALASASLALVGLATATGGRRVPSPD